MINEFNEKHPVLLPNAHNITESIISDVHEKVRHQGRLITLAAVRQIGFPILNPRSTVSSYINKCVTCRRLRGAMLTQQMASLPKDRLCRTAPFETCGMDVFGHFFVHDGKTTRRNIASKKVWIILFTCLYSRAVHLEVLSAMDTSSFMLAFRRFEAIRGKCHLLRS